MQLLDLIPVDLAYHLVAPSPDHEYLRIALLLAGYLWGVRRIRRIGRRIEALERSISIRKVPMNMQFIGNVPRWNGRNGNWKPDRIGYDPRTANFGKRLPIDTWVVHWMDGTLASTDRTFMNPARIASTQFGVEESVVHQYVRLQDTAFHCGNGDMNCRSVGAEMSAQPGRDASDLSYETYSQLVADVARALGKKVSDFTFLRHSDIVATQCCGTVSVDRIRNRALEIEAANLPPGLVPASAPVHVPVSSPSGTSYNFDPFNVDVAPSQKYNEETKRLQRYLVARGFLKEPDVGGNWGYYGQRTQAAVHAFQVANGIVSDKDHYGWWYPRTRAAANRSLNFLSTNNV